MLIGKKITGGQIDYLLFFCDYGSYYEQLPRNWMFSTLDSVSNLYTGNSINATEKKKYFSGVDGINYIATKDVNFDNTINYDNGIRIPDNYLLKFKISYFNSVLLCLEGGSAGRKIGLLSALVISCVIYHFTTEKINFFIIFFKVHNF